MCNHTYFSISLFIIFLCIYLNNGQSDFDYLTKQCEGVPAGDFTSSIGNCSNYIYCDGAETYEGSCEEFYFDVKTQSCEAPENVDCDDSTTNAIVTTTETIRTTNTPATTTLATTSLKTTSEIPNISSTTSTKSYTSTRVTTTKPVVTTDKPVVRPTSCPPVDDPDNIIFLPSSTSCSEYFLCYHGSPLPMYCAQKLHFNSVTDKCDFPENSNCQLSATKPFPECKKDAFMEFFPHPERCEYFLYCVFGHMTVQQCPFYYHWDINKKTCVLQNIAKCGSYTF